MIVSHHDPVEARRLAIQADLDARRSGTERNRLGQFATPNALAVEIARYVKSIVGGSLRAIRFADPSIGTGSFYSAALAVFGRERIERAVGVELDPAFCEAAHDLWADDGLEVVRGDFTRVVADNSHPSPPNLILANPPYVRHHRLLIEHGDKKRIQALVHRMTGIEINGLAGPRRLALCSHRPTRLLLAQQPFPGPHLGRLECRERDRQRQPKKVLRRADGWSLSAAPSWELLAVLQPSFSWNCWL